MALHGPKTLAPLAANSKGAAPPEASSPTRAESPSASTQNALAGIQEDLGPEFDRVLPVLADSWEQLRGNDVIRFFENVPKGQWEALDTYINMKRPDLKNVTQEALARIREEDEELNGGTLEGRLTKAENLDQTVTYEHDKLLTSLDGGLISPEDFSRTAIELFRLARAIEGSRTAPDRGSGPAEIAANQRLALNASLQRMLRYESRQTWYEEALAQCLAKKDAGTDGLTEGV